MGVDSLLPAPMSTESAFGGVNFSNSLVGDPNKKIRKPYTMTKSRQNWTDIEHDKFLEALHLFDRDWKKIEAFVGSKTAIQIRSHAQKYFLKVQKSGTNEHVPPPRPKRKATHPYPHKALKNATDIAIAIAGGTSHRSTDLLKSQDIVRDSYPWPTNAPIQDDVRSPGPTVSQNCCSSSVDSGPGTWPTSGTNNQQKASHRVMPDFPKVYKFLGSVFDPNESNHLHKLKTMDPVDVETVVLLMKNLCANLKSPEFDGYRRYFSSYETESEKVVLRDSFSGLHTMPGNAISSS